MRVFRCVRVCVRVCARARAFVFTVTVSCQVCVMLLRACVRAMAWRTCVCMALRAYALCVYVCLTLCVYACVTMRVEI